MTSLLCRCTQNLFIQPLIDGSLNFCGGAAPGLSCDKKAPVIAVCGL